MMRCFIHDMGRVSETPGRRRIHQKGKADSKRHCRRSQLDHHVAINHALQFLDDRLGQKLYHLAGRGCTVCGGYLNRRSDVDQETVIPSGVRSLGLLFIDKKTVHC